MDRRWERFVADNAALLTEVGMPGWVTDEREYWLDVVHYGYPEQYQERGPSGVPLFDLRHAEHSQLAAYTRLLNRYFEAGFDYVEPVFLKTRDSTSYSQIVGRFGPD